MVDDQKTTKNTPLLTKSEFRSAIQRELRRSGIVGSITAQLRKQVINVLDDDVFYPRTCHVEKQTYENLERVALRSLIMDFLENDGLHNTMSVFVTESMLDSCILSQEDALRTFGIHKGTAMHHRLTGIPVDMEEEQSTKTPGKLSILHLLLTTGITSSDAAIRKGTSTQTVPTAESTESLQARQDLDSQLTKIKERYQGEIGDMKIHRNFTKSLEEKMINFQKECEEKSTREVEEQIKRLKSNTIKVTRAEEAENHRKKINDLRSSLLVEYEMKLRKVKDDEEIAKNSLLFKIKEQELSYSHSRQQLLHEIEILKEREMEGKQLIERERRNLRVEEQRINDILIASNEKLQDSDQRENEMRSALKIEFKQLQREAKRKYNEASDVVKNQYDFYIKQLQGMNRTCESISKDLEKHTIREENLVVLRKEKKDMEVELSKIQDDLDKIRNTTVDRARYIEEIEKGTRHKQDIRDLEKKLKIMQDQVIQYERTQVSHTENCNNKVERLERELERMKQNVKDANIEKEKLQLEKDLVTNELDGVRTLLKRSQNALACIGREEISGSKEIKQVEIHNSNQNIIATDQPQISDLPQPPKREPHLYHSFKQNRDMKYLESLIDGIIGSKLAKCQGQASSKSTIDDNLILQRTACSPKFYSSRGKNTARSIPTEPSQKRFASPNLIESKNTKYNGPEEDTKHQPIVNEVAGREEICIQTERKTSNSKEHEELITNLVDADRAEAAVVQIIETFTNSNNMRSVPHHSEGNCNIMDGLRAKFEFESLNKAESVDYQLVSQNRSYHEEVGDAKVIQEELSLSLEGCTKTKPLCSRGLESVVFTQNGIPSSTSIYSKNTQRLGPEEDVKHKPITNVEAGQEETERITHTARKHEEVIAYLMHTNRAVTEVEGLKITDTLKLVSRDNKGYTDLSSNLPSDPHNLEANYNIIDGSPAKFNLKSLSKAEPAYSELVPRTVQNSRYNEEVDDVKMRQKDASLSSEGCKTAKSLCSNSYNYKSTQKRVASSISINSKGTQRKEPLKHEPIENILARREETPIKAESKIFTSIKHDALKIAFINDNRELSDSSSNVPSGTHHFEKKTIMDSSTAKFEIECPSKDSELLPNDSHYRSYYDEVDNAKALQEGVSLSSKGYLKPLSIIELEQREDLDGNSIHSFMTSITCETNVSKSKANIYTSAENLPVENEEHVEKKLDSSSQSRKQINKLDDNVKNNFSEKGSLGSFASKAILQGLTSDNIYLQENRGVKSSQNSFSNRAIESNKCAYSSDSNDCSYASDFHIESTIDENFALDIESNKPVQTVGDICNLSHPVVSNNATSISGQGIEDQHTNNQNKSVHLANISNSIQSQHESSSSTEIEIFSYGKRDHQNDWW